MPEVEINTAGVSTPSLGAVLRAVWSCSRPLVWYGVLLAHLSRDLQPAHRTPKTDPQSCADFDPKNPYLDGETSKPGTRGEMDQLPEAVDSS